MKRQTMQDERVLAQRRKINSEAYGILMMVLLASMFVQQFFLNAPFKQYAAEFICFFGISIYTTVRYITVGLNLYGEEKWVKYISFISSIVSGITVTVINGISNYIKYAEHYTEDGISFFIATLVITFISATLGSFALLSCFSYLNQKRQEKIQKQLDEDEKNE